MLFLIISGGMHSVPAAHGGVQVIQTKGSGNSSPSSSSSSSPGKGGASGGNSDEVAIIVSGRKDSTTKAVRYEPETFFNLINGKYVLIL